MSEAGETALIGSRFRAERERLGWTLEDVAARLGTTATQLSRLEKGKRRLSVEWIKRLSRAYQMDAKDALTETLAPAATVTLAFSHTITFDQASRILAILKEGK